jgi:hypothetical protein
MEEKAHQIMAKQVSKPFERINPTQFRTLKLI